MRNDWGEVGKIARPVNITPTCEQMKDPTEPDRPFDQARMRIDDCFCELKQSVNVVLNAFAPVIGPEPVECEKPIKESRPPTSDWSSLLNEICLRIHRSADELREIAKRSEV